MHAGKDRIHDAKSRFTYNASARYPVPSPDATVGVRGRLKGADDGGPDGNDAPVARLRALDCCRSVLMNPIGLVEREAQVEHGMSGRRYPGGVRQRSKADATLPPDCLG